MKRADLRRCEKYRKKGYVTLSDLRWEDTALRRHFCLPPRASSSGLHAFLRKAKCPYIRIHVSLGVYHKESAIDNLVNYYSSPMRGNYRGRGTAGTARSHLHATPEILRNPDYLPLRRACQIAGVHPARVSKWVRYIQILPYWDAAGKCLLYSVTELKNLAPWRQYNTIARHLGHAAAEQIKTTRPKKAHRWASGILTLYHAPEISNL